MFWQDEAIILKVTKKGESSAIITLLSKNHGKCCGLVKGITNKRNRLLLHETTMVCAKWQARLPEHLGTFNLEYITDYKADFLFDKARLSAISSSIYLVENLLAEREPNQAVYDSLVSLIANIHIQDWQKLYVIWELNLLKNIGHGLDISQCAISGKQDNLAWISPKTGRAASFEAGKKWADKLLVLPKFITDNKIETTDIDIKNALNTTGWFLNIALHNISRVLPNSRSLIT